MPILTVSGAQLAYGHVALLDGVDLSIEPGERVALIGRNGTGKSSLIKGIAGEISFDDGLVVLQSGATLAWVPQEPQFDAEHDVFDAVAGGLAADAGRIAEYHHVTTRLAHAEGDHEALLHRLSELQSELDASGAWALTHRIERVLSQLGLDGERKVSELSGGNRKRVALARALVREPDLLLLDEPTNHLDIESIAWLENLLLGFNGAVLLITHDRRFLDRVATRIVELDRGRLRSYPGSFSAYRQRKVEELAAEQTAEARFDKLLAQEEVWIRKGVEARRTRDEGRVRRLEALRRERAARRDRLGRVELNVDAGERSGKLVAELVEVSKSFDGRPVVRELNAIIQRGDRVGLIGPNGAGKTTLLKLILGELAPDSGQVRLGTNRNLAYFDQMREQLDEEASLAETISPGSEWVEIGGQRVHAMSYLGRFLFAPERARSPVKSLSGGERNRLLLARLFARPANLLVLDEPTNDLEELLAEYPGTVLVVSHDREFLDNVVTQSIVSLGEGRWQECAGGYSEVEAVRARIAQAAQAAKPATTRERAPDAAGAQAAGAASGTARPARAKLSYKDQRELDALPARIAALEAEQTDLAARLADPATYQAQAGEDSAALKALNERAEAIETELLECLERWETLESRAS
jgi:ATP-binding cassette subfamily F protein uup